MNRHKFLTLIQTLSQGAISSVQSGDSLSELELYLHVRRSIENILCYKMDLVNEEEGGIVLLIGSAGDGKSHLISTIRDKAEYVDFLFYNDATESYSPTKTAVDTLKEVLVDFNDQNVESTHKKMVLNINHGKLNAFIEDDEVRLNYSRLVSLVSKIYSEDSIVVQDDNRIKIVQFNNVHIFEFLKDSEDDYPVDSVFIKTFLQRITQKTQNNPFYQAYLQSKPLDPEKLDPIIFNYEILQNSVVQHCVVKYIIEAIIRFNLIVTPRELQDFVYSILVYDKLDTYTEDKNFIDALLPTTLFTGTRSRIQCALSQLDPIKYSNIDHDEELALLFTSSSVPSDFKRLLKPYVTFSKRIDRMYETRKNILGISQLLFRMKHLFNYHSEKYEYKQYLKFLQGFFNDDGRYISTMYTIVNHVIPRHYGSYTSPEKTVPLNIQGSDYKLFAPVNMKNDNYSYNYKDENNFSLKMSLSWKIDGNRISLTIDYNLFEYLVNLDEGRLSLNYESDKNLKFSRFIRELITYSDSDSEVIVMTAANKKYKLTNDYNILSYRPC